MNETERWVLEARELLRTFSRSPHRDSLGALCDHARKIDLPSTLSHLGCDRDCSECSWGELGGFQLAEACRLVSFLDGLKETWEDARNPASLRAQALDLLRVLDRSRAPN
jgi:hypothetical protein